ncbi:hypothetical protein [Maribacter sp. 2307UL18-2]|uniref:hypothetical protein n=1 Tax=Maribacter sp. 2307UL18-2 TaxID=3386274 RepID=UPI0039BC5017
MKEILSPFGIFILVGLLLTKISAFHVYEHHDTLEDSNTNCELCVLTLEGQQLDGIIPASTTIEKSLIIIPSEPTVRPFDQEAIVSFYKGSLFSRPPPTILG